MLRFMFKNSLKLEGNDECFYLEDGVLSVWEKSNVRRCSSVSNSGSGSGSGSGSTTTIATNYLDTEDFWQVNKPCKEREQTLF